MRCLLMGAPLQCCEGAMQWQQPVRVKAAEPGGCWPRQPTATKKTSTAQAGRRPSDAFGSPRNSRRGSARSARCRLVVVRLYRRIPGGPTATGDHRVWRCDRFEPLWTCRSPLPAIGHERLVADSRFSEANQPSLHDVEVLRRPAADAVAIARCARGSDGLDSTCRKPVTVRGAAEKFTPDPRMAGDARTDSSKEGAFVIAVRTSTARLRAQ